MITEQDRIDGIKEHIKERKEWIRQIIEASARYERLLVDKDFQDVMADMRKVAEIHKNQIDGYVKIAASEQNFFKKLRCYSVIEVHQIRMDQILEAVSEPQRVVNVAREAREELAKIKEQEKMYGPNTN